MERLWTSNASISNGKIKCPIGKSFFAVNLPLKLVQATVANPDTGSLKCLHALFDMYLDHMLVKFEPNCIGRNVHNFELFLQKTSIFKTTLTLDTILQDVSVAEAIVKC